MRRQSAWRLDMHWLCWFQRLKRCWLEADGQVSVEYALIVFALLAVLVGIAALWRAGEAGLFVEQATDAASHQLTAEGLQDVTLY